MVVGDFNSPSSLDWTPAAVAARKLRFPVNWPLGAALLRMGAHDVYREANLLFCFVVACVV